MRQTMYRIQNSPPQTQQLIIQFDQSHQLHRPHTFQNSRNFNHFKNFPKKQRTLSV